MIVKLKAKSGDKWIGFIAHPTGCYDTIHGTLGTIIMMKNRLLNYN
jgi:hypothetical protein